MKDIKILKNGKISKTTLKTVNFETIDYHNTNDIGTGSYGVLRLCVFTGSLKKPKFSHYEYYLVSVNNDNYTFKTDYSSYTSTTHRFSLEIIQVINGNTKRVGDKFTKRGKNLYGNYHELKRANEFDLFLKHEHRHQIDLLKGATL